jgi:alginate O-acetyltransferase complex protein AlgI
VSHLTPIFVLLFLLFLPIYFSVPVGLQNASLLLANLLFLFSVGLSSGLANLTVVGAAFLTYQILRRQDLSARTRKLVIWLSLGLNLSILLGFRYLLAEQNSWPLGLSYFTLTSSGFLLEIYWRRSALEVSFIEFVSMALFLPLALTGPIERFGRLHPQFIKHRRFAWPDFYQGLYYLAFGLLKISTVSNCLDGVIDGTKAAASVVHGWGLFAYCGLAFLKIYAEFSGYADIAMGLSWLLGIRIIHNFNRPYLADSVLDVWRRWHISFNNWLRDFIFFPVFLKTKKVWISFAATLLLIGAWHGLSWFYLNWTIYWMVVISVYSIFTKTRRRYGSGWPAMPKWSRQLMTFTVVSLSALAFLLPHMGVHDLWARISHFELASVWSVLSIESLSLNLLLKVSAAILVMIGFESLEVKLTNSYLRPRTLIFIFIIIFAGEFHSQDFYYLRF